jgi:RNA polymerase sigma-70 factor, ECF subfamily
LNGCLQSPIQNETRTDQDLIAAANAGDAAAFEALYWRHRDWAAQVAFRFSEDHEAALDVLQETFIYLLKKFPGFVLTCQLRTFLYPAIKHLALGMRAKAQREQANDFPFDALHAAEAVRGDSREELAAALGLLPEEQREVLLLRFVDEFSLNEIALALRIPPGTVKSRLHNALSALRRDDRIKDFFQ